jgi:adenylate cyclase
LGGYHILCSQHDRAIAACQRALELNPNDAEVMSDFGCTLSFAGRAKEGLEMIGKAMRLNPHYPEYWVTMQGYVYFDARRYEDAVAVLESLRKMDTIDVYLYLAASHAALGHMDEARAAVSRIFALDDNATIRRCAGVFLNVYKEDADREHLRVNLIKAGLPE